MLIALSEERKNKPQGTFINFSKIAIENSIYNDEGKIIRNGGQIIKEGLKKYGVDVNLFNYHGKCSVPRSRKAKKKLPGGIPMPCEPTTEEVVKFLKEQIMSGDYSMGEIIVPQKFQKLTVDHGEVKVVDIVVSGRKNPLKVIRKQLLIEHKSYMRVLGDDKYESMTENEIDRELHRINEYGNLKNESTYLKRLSLKKFHRSRHLMLWHDTSTISGHSYLLMMIKALYDKALYYSSSEYKELFDKKVCIQKEVEKPVVYIIGRCPPTDEQIKYGNTRLEDLNELSKSIKTENGDHIIDIMRFFHGDGPAASFEIGHQKGKCSEIQISCGDGFCTLFIHAFSQQENVVRM